MDRKDFAILKALLSTIEENGADAVLLFLFSGASLKSEPVQIQWPRSFLDNASLAHYHPEESPG